MTSFYQTCVVISLLQGLSLPFVIVIFRNLSRSQRHKSANLKQELDIVLARKTKSAKIARLIHDDLPKLQPLNCETCGAGVLLNATCTLCPNCGTQGNLPYDYAVAVSLRIEVKRLVKSAVRHWRVANILTLPQITGLLIFLGVVEPLLALLLPVIVPSFTGVQPITIVDKLVQSLGTPLDSLVHLFLISGIIIWALIFLCLAVTAFDLRKQLPVVPVLEKKTRGRETAICHSCAGRVEYDKDDFACICSYCNVENFRVRFTRLKRAESEEQEAQAGFALFGAMEIIEKYVTLVYAGTLIFFGLPLFIFIFGITIYAATTGAFLLSMSAFMVIVILFALGRIVVSEERIQQS